MPGSAKVASERLRGVLEAVATMSSDLSLEGLLDRILRQAGDLVDAESGFLDVLDRRSDRRIGTFAAYNVPGVVDHQHPGRQLLVELLEQPHPRARRGSQGKQQGSAFIGVPIKINNFEFGNLYLIGKRTGQGFTREDEEVAQALASAAGVVIENARLHESGARQRMWLEAAAEITTALLSPISRGTALQLVADRARVVASADFVALLMPHGEGLIVEAVAGSPSEGVLGEIIPPGSSLVGEAARLGQTVVVPDTELDPRYHRRKTPSWPDLGSLMVLPLRSGEETGVLIVGWMRGHQTDRWELDPVVPQGFADQAALVLQVSKAQEDQARLAVFEDRDRIGRDLHDLVIQRLFGIGLMLDNTTKLIATPAAVERLSSAIDDIDQTIKDIRRTIFALSSTTQAADLRTELELVVHDAAKLLGFKPGLTLSGPVDSAIEDDVRDPLLAVLRETLSNIVRHAGAREVSVLLSVAQDIRLEVRDDGDGLGSGTSGNGLRNIRERAELLGGTCVVTGDAGAGTTVLWTVPRRN
ncbi:MAG: GAF domain-containing protein [Aeromicrobium sp.]